MRIKTPSTEGLEYHSPEWFRMCALIEEGRRAGKTVQVSGNLAEKREWKLSPAPTYALGWAYRLMPEPRRVWHEYYPDGSLRHVHWNRPTDAHLRLGELGHTFVEFVEVIKP